jgi:hypothetical protein
MDTPTGNCNAFFPQSFSAGQSGHGYEAKLFHPFEIAFGLGKTTGLVKL